MSAWRARASREHVWTTPGLGPAAVLSTVSEQKQRTATLTDGLRLRVEFSASFVYLQQRPATLDHHALTPHIGLHAWCLGRASGSQPPRPAKKPSEQLQQRSLQQQPSCPACPAASPEPCYIALSPVNVVRTHGPWDRRAGAGATATHCFALPFS